MQILTTLAIQENINSEMKDLHSGACSLGSPGSWDPHFISALTVMHAVTSGVLWGIWNF